MKKLNVIALPLLLATMLLSPACSGGSKDRPIITYGRATHSTDEALIEINYDEFYKRMDKDGVFHSETFLLLITDSSSSCGCRQNSRTCMTNIVMSSGIAVYHMDLSELSGNNKYGVKAVAGEAHLNIISKGKVLKVLSYKSDSLILHEDDDGTTMHEILRVVNYYNSLKYCTVERLEQALTNNETFSVEYIWRDCGDCSYLDPALVWKLGTEIKLKRTLYIVDLADIVAGNKDNDNYKNYLAAHHLSEESDAYFGYDTGKVPTFQHYTEGVLDDAATIFNEGWDKVEGGWRVTKAFFDEGRDQKVHYFGENYKYEPIVGKVYENILHPTRMDYYEPIVNQFILYYCF